MTPKHATKYLLTAAALLLPITAFAQQEGLVPTQTIVRADSKENVLPTATAVTLQLNGKPAQLASLTPIVPSGIQVALLIDDGLSRSAGIQLDDLKGFATNLPPGAEVYVGYMRNGEVETVVPFTTDYAEVASKVRLPFGMPGISASPYFCLSEFVKHWPVAPSQSGGRVVMMVTNGVDPYNGSTSILNQNSPYVDAAIKDAQRAGVSVSSIYYADAGFRGNRGSFSGQSYLTQLGDETGGRSYYEGTGNPVSMAPFLAQFQHAISETYVASFSANVSKNKLVEVKADTKLHGVKLRAPKEVLPGNAPMSAAQ